MKNSNNVSKEEVRRLGLAVIHAEMLMGDCQIASPVADILKAENVSISAMIAALKSANAKRELIKMEATNKTAGGYKDKGAEYSLESSGLTPQEMRVKDFYAWQTFQLKGAKSFGLPASWNLPPSMLGQLKASFPYVKAAKAAKDETTTVPAIPASV